MSDKLQRRKQRAPAFLWYARDWLTDTRVRMCSASTRGIWIDVLSMMWLEPERGIITIPEDKLNLVLTCTVPEAELFLKEAVTQMFANVTRCDGNVTLENRRMHKEFLLSEGSKLRMQRKRGKDQCYGDVTPPFAVAVAVADAKIEKEGTDMSSSGGTALALVPPKDDTQNQAREVLEYLNQSIGAQYRPADGTLKPIIARLREGYTVQDCILVIEGQKMDPYFLEHPKYYRPSTLFGSQKFASYLQAAPKMAAASRIDPEALKAQRIRAKNRADWLKQQERRELEDARQKSLQ